MLSVDVERLGFEIKCRHCDARFVAKDHHQISAAIDDPINFWIKFTDLNGDEQISTYNGNDPYRRPK